MQGGLANFVLWKWRTFCGKFVTVSVALNLVQQALAKMQVAPAVGNMHIDDALRRPDPVVFLLLARLPLDAAEVDAPYSPRLRRRHSLARVEGGQGIGNLKRPSLVRILRVIERPLYRDGCLQAGDVPAVISLAVFVVRLVQEEIPSSVECVDLKLVIAFRLGKRFDKDLEVVVVKNDGVMFAQRGRYVRFLQFGRDVEIFVVVQHLYPRAKARSWFDRSFDVDEIGGP